MRKTQRTDTDFSEHEITESHSDNAKIWKFKKPGTRVFSITFINSNGIMAVTGDAGNWIFCREFHPGGEGVSDGYWCEKLEISSKQKSEVFSPSETKEAIKEEIKRYLIEDCDIDEVSTAEMDSILEWGDASINININIGLQKIYISWLSDCYRWASEGGDHYRHMAYNNLPEGCDWESIIYETVIERQLQVVFDAFDEMTRRMAGLKGCDLLRLP